MKNQLIANNGSIQVRTLLSFFVNYNVQNNVATKSKVTKFIFLKIHFIIISWVLNF